ncbi:hypothetical protein [Tautonia plasticadhaerens]|uniref:Zinc-finger domain-containing protein n=1 Tax=Tautonia plasticadhaerens TaxID=2527974 RepID=A0A518HDY0_9BACT|nr:hypothetical protein [Tautonia plasticadhaerens]QDV39058.1 hypothetical protein ElP_70210 [Tautonia plasticadhaerens]
MPIKTCAWVRARLPLRAGGESLGLDRWIVEGHLVRCGDCRARLEALAASQRVLSAASQEDPVPPDSPSLWPDLSRRLRQSRRPRLRTAWGFEPRWERRAWAWSLGGLAAGLLLAASLVGLGARNDPRIERLVHDYVPRPIAPLLMTTEARPRLLKPSDPEQFERSRPRPRPSSPYRQAHAAVSPPEDSSPPRSRGREAEDRAPVELTQ